jgi:hypothetical protein
MRTDADADLRERFLQLREHDCAAAPAYESVRLYTPASRSRPGLAWTACGFVLAAAMGIFLILRPPTTTLDATAAALPAWQSQTDFLLAGTGDALQRLSWAPSPTSGLVRPTFNHYREN